MRFIGKLVIILLILSLSAKYIQSEEIKVIHAQIIEKKVKIDGKLDENFYTGLKPVENFYQFHPKNGAAPTFKTLVYTYYDRNNIYFAFRCYDEQPEKITADVTPFNEYSDNDEVTVYIDTFRDRRNYSSFSINPRGIKKGEKTVWKANTQINGSGWTAEIQVPFKSLRFPNKPEQEWGINFSRHIFRLNETSYWTQVDRDKVLVLADTFGTLTGLKSIRGGKNIEIFPYAGWRSSTSANEENSKIAYGVDLKYGITSNLTLDFTSSPDYSEVESDPFFYQTEPFEVNLQENRPFYNEASDYFSTDFNLFYSRRIDNPTLASKFTGKAGDFSIGALFAQYDPDNGPNKYQGVFRVKKDILKHSSIGLIYTSVDSENNWNRNYGVDFLFRLKDIYTISGMVAFSTNKHQENPDNGMYFLYIARQVDKGFTLAGYYERIDPDVSVPAGYVPIVNYQRVSIVAKYSFRWEGKWLEKLFLKFFKLNEGAILEELKTNDTYEFMVDFYTRSRFHLQLSKGIGKIRGQIYSPEGLVWDSHLYNQDLYNASLSYNGSSKIQFTLALEYSDDFIYVNNFKETRKGSNTNIDLSTNFKISPQLQFKFSYGKTFLKGNGDSMEFDGDLVSASLNYQVTKRISSFVKFQYDSRYEQFQYDFLLGYEPANVSKIYFSIKNYCENKFRLFDPDVSSISFKISYLLRL